MVDNEAMGNGGAILVQGGHMEISSSNIMRNKAATGGAFMLGGGRIFIYGSILSPFIVNIKNKIWHRYWMFSIKFEKRTDEVVFLYYIFIYLRYFNPAFSL